MSRQPGRRTFYTIDGLRGVAALLIVCRHIVPLHGGQLNFQSSYLAVELFYLFSGFVIAHAYDERFASGLGFWEFAKIRLIRLWPIYFLGFAIAVLTVPAARLAGINTWPLDPAVIIPGIFMLPITVNFAGGLLYPFNNPSWTLFFELVGNFVYAAIARHLTNARLALILLISAGFLGWTAFHFHSLDVGYNRSHFIGGFGRVFFSFFAGAAVYRLQAVKPCPIKISPWFLMAVVVFLLTTTIPKGLDRELYDTGCALVVFPLFAYFATAVEPKRPWMQTLFMQGGATSYALYLIHAPLGGVLNQFFTVYGHPKGSWELGVAFIAAAAAIAWLAEKYYDRPIRHWLTRLTGPRTTPKADAAA